MFFFTLSIFIFSLPSSSSFLTWGIFYELFCGKWLKAFANLNGMCMYIFSCTVTFCYRNDVSNSLYRDRLFHCVFHCVVHACGQYYTFTCCSSSACGPYYSKFWIFFFCFLVVLDVRGLFYLVILRCKSKKS